MPREAEVTLPHQRIFVAIDTTDLDRAAALAESLVGLVGGVKLGKEFLTAHGPQGARRVAQCGMPLFLDTKFHDIPNTVAGALRAALPLKPRLINVHAAGGAAMMRAAADAAAEAGDDRPLVLAVTVLTSLDDDDLKAIGVTGEVESQVVRLARLAQDNGIDGVVCSAKEVTALRDACGPNFKLLTPGIRPAWSATGDQKRIVTPAEAVRLGSDYLVIGRPITGADDPADAARRIGEELAGNA
ncbi:orotidine-5'-phosphate decarboxylase [Magnetospira sp. QH-2]|uniref:orotidine-5'-phosphate decarboxylase n=1 Tax=Magnetospira sp. (strain QH-2) TaxID=1288970 RepID=UPI0003E80E4E|nr:orotidine-5'-phosphate decarboxylase [Magnetospira sp. QH-2]CCQ72599.1 Orotidine 5'-phosphate decarboxylase [Magnetospira sp. QH-2]